MENLIRQTAIKWWRDMSMIDQSFITQKYSTLLHGRGASSLTSREIEMLYLKENSTEAEVGEEEETVEQAAKEFSGIPLNRDIDSEEIYYNSRTKEYNAFKAGAAWQKEQDRELISDLLKIVETLSESVNSNDYSREFKDEVRNSITKAEQRIKK